MERKRLQDCLSEGTKLLSGAPPPQITMREGHCAEEILAEAACGVYDLVVVGARGRRGITRFLLGSTAERIARHASVPVLVFQGESRPVERVLVCTAGGTPGLGAVHLGGRVARLAGARVTVLHVMSQLAATPSMPTPLLGDLEAPAGVLMVHNTREGMHLQQALVILADLDVPAHAHVRHGLVVDEVLAEAHEGDYDLVVIGAHAAEGIMRFLLDDTAHQILSRAERPVLMARTIPPG